MDVGRIAEKIDLPAAVFARLAPDGRVSFREAEAEVMQCGTSWELAEPVSGLRAVLHMRSDGTGWTGQIYDAGLQIGRAHV